MAQRNFVLTGTINFEKRGTTKEGEAYQLIKVSGFTFFLPPQHHNGYKAGQEIQILGSHVGDRYNKKSDSYTPQYDIERITITAEAPIHRGEEVT